jgi:hypothetical protein
MLKQRFWSQSWDLTGSSTATTAAWSNADISTNTNRMPITVKVACCLQGGLSFAGSY